MKKKINKVLKHPLISGSIIIVGGSFLANFINFLFNLFMVRNLSLADYGTLASLVSLIAIATIPVGAFVPTIVRFAASYYAKEEYDMLRGFFFKLNKICFIFAFIFSLVFLIFSENIGSFFHIRDSILILLAGATVIFGFIGIVNAGFLQGKLSFKFLSFINITGAFLKFGVGVPVVYAGFAVKGALSAYFISSFLPYILSFIPLKILFQKKLKTPKIDNREIFTYGVPSAISLLGLTSLISADVILVKHFFDPKSAGIYAVISIIGRIILFLTAPISTVMFPLIVQKHEKNENYHSIFKLAILFVLLPSVCLNFVYFLFPSFIIELVSKKDYISGSYLLGLFGIFITVYSLLTILVNYYLSIKKTIVYIPIMIGAVSQAVLIWFFHNTFLQIILISSSITCLLLLLLLIYYWVTFRK